MTDGSSNDLTLACLNLWTGELRMKWYLKGETTLEVPYGQTQDINEYGITKLCATLFLFSLLSFVA